MHFYKIIVIVRWAFIAKMEQESSCISLTQLPVMLIWQITMTHLSKLRNWHWYWLSTKLQTSFGLTLPLTKHFPLHGSVFCRPETYLPSLERIPFWSHFLTYIAQTDSSSSTSLFPFIHACRSYNFFILAIEGLPSKSFLTSNKTLFPKRIQIGCSTHLSAPLSYSWLSKE